MTAVTVEPQGEFDASPIANPRLRLNAVCPYYTMFPLSFPLAALSDAKAGERVLDPFCGRGTTAYAARLLGLPTVGIDADRVAVTISRAKLIKRSPAQIESRCEVLLDQVAEPADLPDGEFWDLAFHKDTLRDLCRLREALLKTDSADDDVLLRAIVLGILHGPQSVREPNYLSNQMPRTYATKPGPAVKYWRRHDLSPHLVDLRAAVSRRARYVLNDVPKTVVGQVVHGDSRKADTFGFTRRFSHIVTSPPYPGMRTYRPDQWLRHWFLGGTAEVDYSTTDMLPTTSEATFTEELGSVWSAVAKVSRPNASLTVRFGSLPSYPSKPEDVLRQSLAASKAGWRVESVVSAGPSTLGKRQASQMKHGGTAIEEIDLKARLVG